MGLIMLKRDDAVKFANEWAAAWNARDIERVLASFDEGVTFVSPTALAVAGTPRIQGKTALRAYWNQAMSRIGSLRFTVNRVVWDADARELAIIYSSDTDGRSKSVSENLVFNENGAVVSAEVFHGVAEVR
jgi:steroid delta-isomerase